MKEKNKNGQEGIVHSYVSAIPTGYSGGSSGREQVENVLDMLYRRKWLIVTVFVLVAAGAAVYSFTRTPVYESSSLIMVDLGKTSYSKSAGQMSVGADLFATNERSLAGEIFVIESSASIAERVRERLEEPQNGYVRFRPASSSVNAMSVTGVSSDPAQAAMLANLYAEEYINLTKEASRTHMTASREFLEEQEQERLAELHAAEDRVKNYIERAGTSALDRGGTRLVSVVEALQARLDDARIDLESRQATLSSVEEELNTLSPQLADRIASRLDLKINAVQSKLAELEVAKEEILLHNPNKSESELENTRLPQIERQMSQLRGEIESLSSNYVDEVIATGGVSSGEEGLSYVGELKRRLVQERIAINGLTTRIDIMQRRMNERQAELNAFPEQAVDLARLERAKQQAEQAYNFVAQQLRTKRIEEETEPGYAHILRTAVEPVEPVAPDHPRNLILGGFFGILLALGSAVGRDKLDNRIYKPGNITEEERDVIGVIPNMQPVVKTQFSKAEFTEQGGRRYATSLLTHLSPYSTIAESYRHIRTRIQFSLPDKVIQTMLVTSPGMGEGKSTTAANLAIIMAQADRRTLLIDADLRRPQQRRMFDASSNASLEELLAESASIEKGSIGTDIENLYLITARNEIRVDNGGFEFEQNGDDIIRAAKNPAELLGSARMRELLVVLKERFDVIIIDTPPLGAATDAALLSTQCDATIVVARAGKTKEAEVDDAYATLENVGATVIGTILNGFDVSLAYGQKYKHDYSKYGIYSQYQYYDTLERGSGTKNRRLGGSSV